MNHALKTMKMEEVKGLHGEFWLTGMGGEHVLLKMGSADRPFRCQGACAHAQKRCSPTKDDDGEISAVRVADNEGEGKRTSI